jgi:hypothetical protein
LEGDERMRSVDRERHMKYRNATARHKKLKEDDNETQRRREVAAKGVAHGGESSSGDLERVLSQNRADYAIKEAQRKSRKSSPVRGRQHNYDNAVRIHVDEPS